MDPIIIRESFIAINPDIYILKELLFKFQLNMIIMFIFNEMVKKNPSQK